MTLREGFFINEYGGAIVPEHPILTRIKEDSKTNNFGYNSVYNRISTDEFSSTVKAMEEFGTVLSGAIFNGNYKVPAETIAKLENFLYKGNCSEWYPLLSLVSTDKVLTQESQNIIEGLCNYQLLSYADITDCDTSIKKTTNGLALRNIFTERFSFNALGQKYLRSLLDKFTEYQCIMVTPNRTSEFVDLMADYIQDSEIKKPATPVFSKIMGDGVSKAMSLGLFGWSNIVLVSEDLLILAFDKELIIDCDAMNKDFTTLYKRFSKRSRESRSQAVLSSFSKGSYISMK